MGKTKRRKVRKVCKRKVRKEKLTRKVYVYKTRILAPAKLKTTHYTYKLKNGESRTKKCFDKRSFRGMRNIFDPPKKKLPECLPSKSRLEIEKRVVINEIKRQQHLSTLSRGSPLERAFYVATGEKSLLFDYPLMLRMVKSARLIPFKKNVCDSDALGYMDPNVCVMKINSLLKMTRHDLRITLMHEALHGTVKRQGRGCPPDLSTDLEHLAMALLGDPDEYNDFYNDKKSLRLAKKRGKGRAVVSGFIGHEEYWDHKMSDYQRCPW